MLPGGAVIAICLVVAAVSVSLVGAGWLFSSITGDLPSIDGFKIWLDPQKGSLLQPTLFYDRSGQTVISTLENPGIQRKFLSVDPSNPAHFSPQLVRAWVGLQQSDYWRSRGIDTTALLDPEPRTISEKLVASLLLEKEEPGTRSAIRMRLLASQLFQQYGASQVLEWYLNSADFGHLAYGAESAAQLYFGKSAANLDLYEAAILVMISESPALNPIDAPAHSEEMQKEALNRLLLAGLISSDDYIQRLTNFPKFAPAPVLERNRFSAFIDLAKDQLESTLGRERLERGGLQVVTSLDLDLQDQLACTLQTQMLRMRSTDAKTDVDPNCPAGRLLPALKGQAEASADNLNAEGLVTDPRSGEVLAYSGMQSSDGSFHPSSAHEPGSLLTPFVAAGAFARGYSPASLVWDIPDENDPAANASGNFHGPVSLRTALANDYLAPIVRIFEEIGGQSLAQLWAPFGLGKAGQTTPESSLLREGGVLSLIQAAQAYGILAAGGQSNGVSLGGDGAIHPSAIIAVEDSHGTEIPTTQKDVSLPVLSEPLAYLLNSVLSDESARKPSLGSANPLEIGRPAGGKIGQTVDGNSLWAVGYTPQRLVAAWVGKELSGESAQLEGRSASGVTHALLQYATRELPVEGWRLPGGVSEVTVCDPSGELPTKDCPTIVKDVFLSGSEPTSTDPMYQRIAVNRETGRLATVFTPAELQEEDIFLVVPSAYRRWAEKAGFPLAPTEYDTIQAPAYNPNINITSPAGLAFIRGKTEILGNANGDNFSSYRLEIGQGVNPGEWIQIGGGKSTVENGLLGEWDTSGREGLYAVRLIVVNQNQEYQTAVVQVAVDNTPPEVRVSYPLVDESLDVSTDGEITLRVEAEDAIGISRVEWWLDNVRIGSREQPPYSLPWKGVAGEHLLIARAFDQAGNMGESEPVRFKVVFSDQ